MLKAEVSWNLAEDQTSLHIEINSRKLKIKMQMCKMGQVEKTKVCEYLK